MEYAEAYHQELSKILGEITECQRPLVIFGADRAGWYAMKVLEHHGISVTAFADNDPCKQGTYNGYRVFQIDQVAKEYPDAYVILGVFIRRTAEALKVKLREAGLHKICYATPAFIFSYMVDMARRECDHDTFARSLGIMFRNYAAGDNHYGYIEGNYFVSPFVTGVITQKCSLRCRDCGQRIPYYSQPVNYPVENIVNDIRRYAAAFDVVPEISLQGGEPFMHPDVAEICRQVARIANIVFISFITNGTILPSKSQLNQLASCGADVHQSDYGELSRKKDRVAAACRSQNVYSDILYTRSNMMWERWAPFRKHHRNPQENDRIYQGCISTKLCCQIMAGELHRCSVSMHGSHQGLVPKNDEDYICLHDDNASDDEMSSRIRKFLSQRKALTVCDYCDPGNWEEVPRAIQISRNEN